jgi:hypothetical protein
MVFIANDILISYGSLISEVGSRTQIKQVSILCDGTEDVVYGLIYSKTVGHESGSWEVVFSDHFNYIREHLLLILSSI